MLKRLAFFLLLATRVAPGYAQGYGSLANFDVVNDTGKTAHGFEIDIEGINSSDITSLFGAADRWPNMERYGSPKVTDTGSGVKIVYEAAYKNGSWSAGTPSGTLSVSPSDSCWPLGAKDYGPNYPCDHFGVSTSVSTPNVTYSWLVETAPGAGTLVVAATNVPNPVWTVTPVPPVANVPQPPKVNVVIAAPQPNGYEFGEARWVKVTATGTVRDVAVEDLVAENAIIKKANTQVQIEWQLLQVDNASPGSGQIDLSGVALDQGATGVVYRFEFYKYTGTHDPETYEALPLTSDTPVRPDPKDLGAFIVAQNAGINFDGVIPAAPPLPIAPTLNATIGGAVVGVPYDQVISGKPGNAGDTLSYAVTGLPHGLSFDSLKHAIIGTPSVVGIFPLKITVTDHTNGLSTTGNTQIQVADQPIVFKPSFAPATVGEPYSQTFSATGGYGAIAYSIFEKLPAGLTLSGKTVSGKPTVIGTYPLTVTAKDALGYSQVVKADLVVGTHCAGVNQIVTNVTALTPVWIDIAGGVGNGGKSVLIPPANATTINPPLTVNTAYKPGVLATYTGTMDQKHVFCVASNLTLSEGLTLPVISLANGQVGHVYGPVPVVPAGGIKPYNVAVSKLPAGLKFDGGKIHGTPTLAGTFTVGFSASDSNGEKVFFTSSLLIKP